MTYTTIQGDMWDIIALKVYGSEMFADFLMANNFSLLDIVVFPAGIVLNTPALPQTVSATTPPWRT